VQVANVVFAYLCWAIMKKSIIVITLIFCLAAFSYPAAAQCSICNKTVMQMGSKPAQGFNTGILYLMAIPYAAVGFISYKWWRSRRSKEQ
jgi:hypothetical protein